MEKKFPVPLLCLLLYLGKPNFYYTIFRQFHTRQDFIYNLHPYLNVSWMIQQLMTLLSVLKICVHFYSYKYYVMWDLMNDWIYMYWREVNVFGVDVVNVKQKLSYSSSSVFKNKIRSTKFDISCKFIYFLSHLLLVLEAVLIRDYQRFH